LERKFKAEKFWPGVGNNAGDSSPVGAQQHSFSGDGGEFGNRIVLHKLRGAAGNYSECPYKKGGNSENN
jgi:hypothetical protein